MSKNNRERAQKIMKAVWESNEAAKTQAVQNVVLAARSNEVKVTGSDLQKILYVINSSFDQVFSQSSKMIESKIASEMEGLVAPKSDKK